MLNISESKIKKKNNKKILNHKLNSRNNKKLNIRKSSTSSTHNNNERFSILGPINKEFIFQLEKKKQLNSLKKSSNKVVNFMHKLDDSLKVFNRDLSRANNPLMVQNLTNISFKRSIMIRKKLRNLDRMNTKFENDYNIYKFNLHLNDNNKNYIINEEEKKKEKERQIKEDDKLRPESIKILNKLFKNNDKEVSLSDYKKNKKLKELKTSIDYICGTESNEQKRKKENLATISHYSDVVRSPSFIREKSKNASFIPSVKYNKENIYYSKKYDLVQEIMDKDKELIEKINRTIQISPKNKITYRLKMKNQKLKRKSNTLNNYSTIKNIDYPIKITEPYINNQSKTIEYSKNNFSDKLNSLSRISQKDDDKKNIISLRHKITYSPIQSYLKTDPNNTLYKKFNTINNEIKIRCKTSHNISYISKNNLNSNNNSSLAKSSINKMYPLIENIKNLLNDNYKLKDDLKFEYNIITNKINDFKKKKKMKVIKNELNIDKLRKDLNLINVNPIVDEVDVLMNNVKKMEKIMKKKDINLLMKVAKTVIREDKLANRYLIYRNNPLLLLKMRKQNKKKVFDDEEKGNLIIKERNEMFKLFKNDGPDFNNEEYLSNLIKRYKSMKIK